MTVRFSVIVPVYGVEKYISRCIDSIIAQDFTDFELIIVDDGSKDTSPEICDRYAANDSRVRVIHKENGGLVSARKAGMAQAHGDYIINVDGDDWIEQGYLRTASEIINEYSPDIVTFAINYVRGDDVTVDPEPIDEGLYSGDALRTVTDNMLMTPDMRHMHYFLWGKAFRRDVIADIELAADERISMGEDVMCVIPAYCRAESVYVSAVPVYDCRCRSDSMSRSYKSSHFDDITLGVKLLREVPDQPAGYSQSLDRYAAFMFFVIFATAAADGARSVCRYARSVWNSGFDLAFARAEFDTITAKSKIAMSLLSRRRFGAAYAFLRICSKLKGNT